MKFFFYTSFLNHCLGLVKIEDGDFSTSSAHAQCQVPNFMTSVSNSWEAVNTRCLRNALQGFTSPNRKLTCCHLASYESSKGYIYLLWKFYILIKIWILVCLFVCLATGQGSIRLIQWSMQPWRARSTQ